MEIRKAYLGKQKAWSREEIIAGVKKFISETNRFPKSIEFDSYPYLPTSRSVQRTFGGVLNLKRELGISDSYHDGEYRSNIAKKINLRGQEDERGLGVTLEQIFGEVCVHYQGLAGSRKERLDFVIFHAKGKFGVDTFFPDNIHNLATIVNNKQKKYLDFHNPIFFVAMNSEITDSDIDQLITNKENQIRNNVRVVSIKKFLEVVKEYKRREYSLHI